MNKKHFVVVLMLTLLLALLGATPVGAAPNAQTASVWTGFYFSNPNLQGSPAFTRDDPSINFVWGSVGPGGGIGGTNFSVRWLRWVFIDTPGNWTFTTTTDDGVRLFVDDQLVIDQWHDQQPTAYAVTLNLTQAFHLVRMEYFQRDGTAQAQLQIVSANYPDWRGEYYGNPNLAGNPVFVRNDSAINFNFGTSGPGGGIPGVNFSVRWTRIQYFNSGRYRFTTTTDDGVRLWVDNQLLIDQWHEQQPTSWSGDITLLPGNHWVKMEYFQAGGSAMAQLSWTPLSSGGEAWRGEYFDNPSLSGSPTLSRDEAEINFDWGTAPPGSGISQGGNWSARFTSRRAANSTGYYTVWATADDGVRVWVDNTILIDQWHDQSPTTYAAMVYLAAGQHDWRIEHYQHTGTASLRVTINSGATPAPPGPQPIPGEVVVDDGGPGFMKGGAAARWHDFAGGIGGHAFWTENNTYSQSQYNWARWYPTLPNAGYYEVSVYLPAGLGTTRNARYWISHAGTYNSRNISQALYANQWVSLGTYYFSATGGEYVSLANVTYEPFFSTVVAVDAVKFTAR